MEPAARESKQISKSHGLPDTINQLYVEKKLGYSQLWECQEFILRNMMTPIRFR